MPNLIKQIPETMRKLGIPKDVLARFDVPETAQSEDVMALIQQMDALLTEAQRLSVMEQQGCCKTGIGEAAHRAFGIANAALPLAEKVTLLNQAEGMPHRAPCRLNEEGTLSVYWGSADLKKRSCPCGIIRKLPEGAEVPRTFCGCCGGHIRSNYQKSLGIKLRLKQIVSSSSSSKGRLRCEFLFDIIG